MKASFTMTALLTPLLKDLGVSEAKVIEACEASRNSRKVVEQEQTGQKYVKKDALSRSGETVTYEQVHTKVTAFMQWAEAEVGQLDKAVAKLKKLGLTAESYEVEIPATLHGQDVAGWLRGMAKPAKGKKLDNTASDAELTPAALAANGGLLAPAS